MSYIDNFKVCNFVMQLRDQKHLEFFTLQSSIPAYTIGTITIPNHSMTDKRPGDSIDFADLSLTVLCDEDLKAYKDVYNYLNLAHDPISNKLEVQQEVFDATLFLTTNKNNVSHTIKFFDMWIESVSALDLLTTSTDDNSLSFTVNLKYNYFIFA
jgi:hypothetical protein